VIPCLPVYQPWLAGKVVKLIKDMRILGNNEYRILMMIYEVKMNRAMTKFLTHTTMIKMEQELFVPQM
jgi:hypothetical protein